LTLNSLSTVVFPQNYIQISFTYSFQFVEFNGQRHLEVTHTQTHTTQTKAQMNIALIYQRALRENIP